MRTCVVQQTVSAAVFRVTSGGRPKARRALDLIEEGPDAETFKLRGNMNRLGVVSGSSSMVFIIDERPRTMETQLSSVDGVLLLA